MAVIDPVSGTDSAVRETVTKDVEAGMSGISLNKEANGPCNCWLGSSDSVLCKAVDEMAAGYNVSEDKVRALIQEFHKEMGSGLEADGCDLAMIPSYVTHRPTGKEKGTFLSLDLGGTNLRVCQVTLNGDSTYKLVQHKFEIPDEKKKGPLFDWIAQCVGIFMELHEVEVETGRTEIPCGFTFSFPIIQTGIAEGSLLMWNKGFSVPNSVGRDVVRLMQDAFLRRHLRVKVVAIVNDTVGALMASQYIHPSTHMGIIFGTGTNAAYWQDVDAIGKWTSSERPKEMVVNMEWGGFDRKGVVLPYTPQDNKLNRKSPNHGLQIFEKMISGMYLGEVMRNALLSLVDRRLLFGGRSSDIFNKSYSFETAYMSRIEVDDSDDLEMVRIVFEETLEIPDTTLVDRRVVKRICNIIGKRAVKLSAASMIAVLSWKKEVLDSEVTVGIDGSMFQFYPGFEEGLMSVSRDILGPEKASKIKLVLAKDGSGVGAAIVAMSAVKEAAALNKPLV